jgi:hypothetical protein
MLAASLNFLSEAQPWRLTERARERATILPYYLLAVTPCAAQAKRNKRLRSSPFYSVANSSSSALASFKSSVSKPSVNQP